MKIRRLRLVYCSQHVAQWYEDHNGMYICVALVAPDNEWIYMMIAMCCLRHAHLVLVVLCLIWWFALYMIAQLIYAHQCCTWAMFPTSWHRCWHDNPTCLCAVPQRPALSQHMASVECGDATVELCMDAKLGPVGRLLLFSLYYTRQEACGLLGLHACFHVHAHFHTHTCSWLTVRMCTFTHVYVCVFAQTRSLYLVPFFSA